eukprot:4857849-Karenia_brevis.AAC.1
MLRSPVPNGCNSTCWSDAGARSTSRLANHSIDDLTSAAAVMSSARITVFAQATSSNTLPRSPADMLDMFLRRANETHPWSVNLRVPLRVNDRSGVSEVYSTSAVVLDVLRSFILRSDLAL